MKRKQTGVFNCTWQIIQADDAILEDDRRRFNCCLITEYLFVFCLDKCVPPLSRHHYWKFNAARAPPSSFFDKLAPTRTKWQAASPRNLYFIGKLYSSWSVAFVKHNIWPEKNFNWHIWRMWPQRAATVCHFRWFLWVFGKMAQNGFPNSVVTIFWETID